MGSVDHPFNPISLALGAEATFVGRALDSDRKSLTAVLKAAAEHRGTALVEIFQDCPIFNDGSFDVLRKGDEAASRVIPLTHGEPIRFGPAGDDGLGTYAVVQEGFGLRVAKADEIDAAQIVVHDATDHELAFALSRLSDQDLTHTVTGIFRNVDRSDLRRRHPRPGAAGPRQARSRRAERTCRRCSTGATPGPSSAEAGPRVREFVSASRHLRQPECAGSPSYRHSAAPTTSSASRRGRERTRSTVKTTSATQTRPNPTHRSAGITSPYTTTPSRNCRVGARYWSVPRVVSGMRRAAAPKSRSGTAVTGPVSYQERDVPRAVPGQRGRAGQLQEHEVDGGEGRQHDALGRQTRGRGQRDGLLDQAVRGEADGEPEPDPRHPVVADRDHQHGRRRDPDGDPLQRAQPLAQHDHADEHADERADVVPESDLHDMADGRGVDEQAPVDGDQRSRRSDHRPDRAAGAIAVLPNRGRRSGSRP